MICATTGEYGAGSEALDEAGYIIGFPPCVFGDPGDGKSAQRAERPRDPGGVAVFMPAQ